LLARSFHDGGAMHVSARGRLSLSVLFIVNLSIVPAAAQSSNDAWTWKFNFDASWGTFGFGNSLYNDPREDVPTNLSDQWFEGAMKAAISGTYTFLSSSELYGVASAVGERTYGSAPSLVGSDISSFGPEDLAVGWRSGKSIGGSEHLIDVSIGRLPYRLGHGMLLFDGAAEGGSRGGYWTNARKAFEFGAVARFSPGSHRAELFYLDKDDLDENDVGTRVAGYNYEYVAGEHSTFGATFLHVLANSEAAPGRDGMSVFNLRAYTAPFPAARHLAFEAEYASERNGDLVQATAWNAQAAYTFEPVSWSPRVSYRYALFSGDDPDTAADETFDPLLTGFHDWGTWWQGEIAGGYAISNSNLISHQFRLHVDPRDSIGGGAIVYHFAVDRPETFEQGVTARALATEVDLYTDWKITDRVTASFILAFADPHEAAQQAFDRSKNFVYGMVFIAYSY
jgi:hypothetical protein